MNTIADPTLDIARYVDQVGARARACAREMARASSAAKNAALLAGASAIRRHADQLVQANALDLAAAKQAGHDAAFVDRLALTPAVIESMAQGLEQIAALADPVGEMTDLRLRPSGIQVGRMRVPLGVIGIIYESRPNVTIDAAGLCIKSGNATILRGGSEAIHSNQALAELIREGLVGAGLPADGVQLIATTDRAAVGALITSPQWVDVIVPRGGKSLIERISNDAKVPVIKHLDGICHVYIDDQADLDKAVAIADNAKTQRYSPCNTMETLLVHQAVADQVLPGLCRIYVDKGVELRADQATRSILATAGIACIAATRRRPMHKHLPIPIAQQARHRIAIAAIIARTAQNNRASHIVQQVGPSDDHEGHDTFPSALHQHRPVDPPLGNGRCLNDAHLGIG